MRVLSIFLLTFVWVFAQSADVSLQFSGVNTVHKHPNGEIEKVHIQRQNPKECIDVSINYKDLFSADHAGEHVPKQCVKKFVTTVGKLTPMQMHPKIKTIAELEVLTFIKNKLNKNPQAFALIDSRRPNWFETFTIPSAINLPFNQIEYDPDFPEDFEYMLNTLGIDKTESGFDFSKAKTVVLFCNGPWCGQSPRAIHIFLKMGYPPEKMLWYRGGIESWLVHGFSTIKPKL